jgi:hypothetical protein
MARTRYPDTNARALSILLIGVQLAVSIGATYFVTLQTFSVAGCGDRCDYDLVTAAFRGTIIAASVALLGSIGVVVARSRQGLPSWWAPVAGMVLVMAAATLAVLLVRLGTA